ncbi:hypothetical protein [Chromobacterium haemolyticum]|uniref:hypothetical protein n=1 Tax=Chromobacterium haemolyticum TaxID=394935 RepID=UPI00307DAC95
MDNTQIIQFTFTDSEKNAIFKLLSEIIISPYQDYDNFISVVSDVVRNGNIPERFMVYCENKRKEDERESPYTVFDNCPIDIELPWLGFVNPVVEKRKLKKTYVAEGMLSITAILFHQSPIGYINVNDGDVFQDIHPKDELQNSQSQKALNEIFFHKDLANHFVRPDWVNILGLRNSKENMVYTCFSKNVDILSKLSIATKSILTENLFHTPFDDLSMHKSHVKLGEADIHPVLGGSTLTDIRYFENRTKGINEIAERALLNLNQAIHDVKIPVFICPGLFMGAANNDCLHNKEIHKISNPEALKNRWLMKTVNVKSLEAHYKYFVPGRKNIVAG